MLPSVSVSVSFYGFCFAKAERVKVIFSEHEKLINSSGKTCSTNANLTSITQMCRNFPDFFGKQN